MFEYTNYYCIFQCIVCQAQQGAIFCSITYTSALSTKERLAHSRFKPSFYFVVFPNEVVFYCLKKSIPQVISETLIHVYDATRLIQLPLEGKYFRSLRQLHLNKIHKGRLCRRPVNAKHPMDSDVEMSDSDLSGNWVFFKQIVGHIQIILSV